MEPASHGLPVETKIDLILREYLLHARHLARCFANITSNPNSKAEREVTEPQFYRLRNWGSERLNNEGTAVSYWIHQGWLYLTTIQHFLWKWKSGKLKGKETKTNLILVAPNSGRQGNSPSPMVIPLEHQLLDCVSLPPPYPQPSFIKKSLLKSYKKNIMNFCTFPTDLPTVNFYHISMCTCVIFFPLNDLKTK